MRVVALWRSVLVDPLSLHSGLFIELQTTFVRVASLSFQDIPVWAWSIAGVVVWRLLKGVLVRPGRKRRASKANDKKAVYARHRRWRKEARAVLKRLSRSSLTDDQGYQIVQGMSAYAFEYLITEGFREQGFEIRKLKRSSGDGGIDGMVKLDGCWHLIQAKRYNAPVSTATLNEFYQVCVERRMPGLFVATNGFTSPASAFAKKAGRLTLLNGMELISIFRA